VNWIFIFCFYLQNSSQNKNLLGAEFLSL